MEITFNQQWTWLHPMVLSMVASLGLRRDGKGIVCNIPRTPTINYLTRMKLFEFLKVPSEPVHSHEPAGRFIPLTNIRHGEDLKHFIEDLVPLLHTDPNTADAIKYTISELVRNVLEHSKSEWGAVVCAQFFKKSNKISIGVADTGIGIKESIGNAYSPNDDTDALLLALTPGVTGTTAKSGGTEQNAGAGLFFIKSIAKVNRQFFVIYSGSSMYKLLKTPRGREVRLYADPRDDGHSQVEGLPYWEGTVVGVDISIGESQNFKRLLELIRQVYRLELKGSRKRARFI